MNRAGTQGTLDVIDGRSALHFERRLAHPVEKVWRAITEEAHLARWFPAAMRMELRVGAPIQFVFSEGEWEGDDTRGEITALDPPRLFEFTWNKDVLRWELRPEGDGCLLSFLHTFDDRAGAASFAGGWEACFEGLDAVLVDAPAPDHEAAHSYWIDRHEEYIERFGLAEGTVQEDEGGWLVRFERQLIRPVDDVWAELNAGDGAAGDEAGKRAGPNPGGAPPLRMTNGYVAAGAVTALEAPRLIEYEWMADGAAAGRVRWQLSPGAGGARLVLTQTVPRERPEERITALAAWHTHLEVFASHLRGREVCTWPAERTEELRRHYADRVR